VTRRCVTSGPKLLDDMGTQMARNSRPGLQEQPVTEVSRRNLISNHSILIVLEL
jgi:hypothetical protein